MIPIIGSAFILTVTASVIVFFRRRVLDKWSKPWERWTRFAAYLDLGVVLISAWMFSYAGTAPNDLVGITAEQLQGASAVLAVLWFVDALFAFTLANAAERMRNR